MLVKLPNLKVIRLKRSKIELRNFAKIYRRLYGGVVVGQVCAPHHTNVCKISRPWRSYIFVNFQQITLKLGNFTNINALFPVVLTVCPWLVHVKSWKKKPWEGLFVLANVRFKKFPDSCGRDLGRIHLRHVRIVVAFCPLDFFKLKRNSIEQIRQLYAYASNELTPTRRIAL